MEGSNLNMALGYSHPVLIVPPAGVTLSVEANTKISVKGSNKQTVGDVAAFIRSKRPPEVYKGKGVKYEGEHIRRKAGKAGKNSATHVDKWAASLAQILNWFWYDKPAFRLNYKKKPA